MAIFILNEWIWADLGGRNGPEKQQQAILFLEQFIRSNHQILLLKNSSFDKKAWDLCSSENTTIKSIAKLFVLQVRNNLDHCVIIEKKLEIIIPAELMEEIKPDDHYLVETYYNFPEATIITTDRPLLSILRKNKIPSQTRDQFLREFFQV